MAEVLFWQAVSILSEEAVDFLGDLAAPLIHR
jgi:hypothetical protein